MKTTISLLALALLASAPIMASPAIAQTAPSAAPAVKAFTVKGLTIGEGRPKTIVPLTGKTAAADLEQVARIAANPAADVIEFRIDYLDIATSAPDLITLGRQVAAASGNKPIILTFRTKAEGGATAISDTDYGALMDKLIEARFADMVDVEMFRDEAVVRAIVAKAHAAGQKVVMSNHDFGGTPDTAELVSRLRRQDALGADVLKIAVMPHDAGDVLKLLDATWQMRSTYTDKPLLTMSMGGTGVITRLSGETFGSAMTFGMMGTASAPGQIDVGQLQQTLDILHSATVKK
ncbi:MAG: type I 3-dehydroquinate dehydratase [Asticcacaulis sp.]|uniref:type I 3-dehydroquinate dehydratase n=1 Tax=Asticcacaulis sp. TaxID=1872648 RepID=UPI0039E2BF34